MDKEGEIMERIMNRMNEFEIPPYIQKEIGLKKNWQKKVSPEFADNTLKSAKRLRSALRKLSKN